MKSHVVCAGPYKWEMDEPPNDPAEQRKHVEPWLAALLQAEHLNLLVGSGLTTAIANKAGVSALDMSAHWPECDLSDVVEKAARESASRCQRGQSNIEDQIRVMVELIRGLQIIQGGAEPGRGGKRIAKSAVRLLKEWETELDTQLRDFLSQVLKTEQAIRDAFEASPDRGEQAFGLLGSFLLTFASRAASRERLHIFTTNYDRLIEYGCDHLGLWVLDRFVGRLCPVFRSSRLGVDLHYNPPGIRGEPRYLEGVVRLTKLHGSVDWRREESPSGSWEILRYGIPFGQMTDIGVARRAADTMVIYPNPAKDVEALVYPYAELFRDFATAACQPNTVLVTYGYGFGDDHINRVLRDMLTIPSTHLAVISYDDPGGRIQRFCDKVDKEKQITLLLGNHFGEIGALVDYYLPKPAIDNTTLKMVSLLNRRALIKEPEPDEERRDPGSEVRE